MRTLWLVLLAACSYHAASPSPIRDDGAAMTPADALAIGDAASPAPGDAAGPNDAGATSGVDAGPIGPVVVACYSQTNPTATCTAPDHCCFTNYTSFHDGTCSTGACSYGTIACDGPEDCAGGQYCCAHAIRDPDFGTIGYTVACQATACGAAPFNQELCHSSTTCSHGSCVGALGNDNDLPRALSICQ